MAEEQIANPCAGPTGFIYVMVAMFVALIIFDPALSEAVIIPIGWLMEPITFDDQFPLLTIILSGVILVVITSIIRHKLTDWFEMAKIQKLQSAFNKELRDATLSGNTIKTKKLKEMQPEIMAHNTKLMFGNFKVMIFTMLIAILIWRWLFFYLEDMAISTISLPWEYHWPMNDPVPFCYSDFFRNWIAVYFVISIPVGQMFVSMFKVMEFSKDIKGAEQAREDSLEDRLEELEDNIRSAERDGITTGQVRNLKIKVQLAIDESNFNLAETHLKDAESILDQNITNHKRTMEVISTTKVMLDSAAQKGVNVSPIQLTLTQAESAMARHDYTKAIYHAKQCQQKLRIAKDKYGEAEEALKDVKDTIAHTPDSVKKIMTKRMTEAEEAMSSQDYDHVMESVKKLKGEADTTQRQYEMAQEQLEQAKKLRDTLRKLSINVMKIEDDLRHAEDKFNLAEYDKSLDLARDVTDELEKLKKLYKDASESVSFAKLVVTNARSFGANVIKAEGLLSEAEMALTSHDYNKALSKSTTAKTLAEDAKRQIQRQEKRSRR
jgi:uncharacterized membrane protein (DUF106 family)